jgi:hypothetical protein
MATIVYIDNVPNIFAISDNQRFNNDPAPEISTPFLLPITAPQSIPNFGGIQPIPNHGGIQDPKTQMENPSKAKEFTPSLTTNALPCNNGNLDDNFDSSAYKLGDGQISPNGKWQNVYNGFGSSGVEHLSSGNVFYLIPKVSTAPSQTSAALVKSTGTFCNYNLDFDMKTIKQLRQNSPPNTWEAGWIVFRYTDIFHYYWFLIKPNGIEFGKKDCDTCSDPVDGQQFLVTKDNPTLQLLKWNHVTIDNVGNHIKISVDGKLVVDFIDNTMSAKLSSGAIAMYSEDASVRYDNMHLVSK